MFLTATSVSPVNEPKQTKVPMTPNKVILPMFAKNFLRYMLKPLAKMIGGRIK